MADPHWLFSQLFDSLIHNKSSAYFKNWARFKSPSWKHTGEEGGGGGGGGLCERAETLMIVGSRDLRAPKTTSEKTRLRMPS